MLNVVACVPAGQETTKALSGVSAARIFTGAPIPNGADAVVMQEDVTPDCDVIHLYCRPLPGLNIRRAGSDLAESATVLDKGHRLDPREIAACAAAAAAIVRVHPRLRVALLVTGDEVRKAGGAREAAHSAGYSPKTAHSQGARLLHHPGVQEEIRRQTFAHGDHLAPLAIRALVDVIEDPAVRPRDKIKAAEVVLDRGFVHRKATAEVSGKVMIEPSTIIEEV